MKCHVFVDFDGTIVPQDATDRIFEAFAEPAWMDVEADWKAGKIGSRECMSQQVALLRATPDQIDDLISTFEIDPGFPAFVEFCRQHNCGISVLSDGLDLAVHGVLRKYEVDLPFAANNLVHVGADRWQLRFPHKKPACTSAAGNCKCAAAMATGAPATIMVGDGRSDFCISNRATFVLAKGSLTAHCIANELPHKPFTVFDEATAQFALWFKEQSLAEADLEAVPDANSSRRVAGR